MKAKLAAAALFFAAATASAAIDAYRTGITLPQAVKLGDGSVLPAGKYDVKIDYKGFGNSAEFLFFQGGVLKGKAPAEARGFPSQAPAGVNGDGKTGFLKIDGEAQDKDHKASMDVSAQKAAGDPAAGKVFPKVETGDKYQPGAAAASFSWGAHGFPAGIAGKTAPVGQSLKLSFDSTNSAAGFAATLPVAGKK